MARKRKPIDPQDSSEVVTYKAFFQQSLTLGRVKYWQEKEIGAFFKSLGLTDKEPVDKYKSALAKY